MDSRLDGLPAEALAFLQQALDEGNALLDVLRPPPQVTASVYVMLARPCRALPGAPDGVAASFGLLAPGLPAVVIIGAADYPSDPPAPPEPESIGKARAASNPALVRRFARSMALDHDAWHEGTPYDLTAIDEASAAQREDMLALLLETELRDWRDIQAVARIGGRRARRALRRSWRHGSAAQRMAMLQQLPGYASTAGRAAALVQALAETRLYEGLSQCLDQVQDCHPPEVIAALWTALLRPEAEVTVHCAAMLAWLHGLADAPFDWQQRPFFLRFGSDDPAERAAAQAELRQRCTMAPAIEARGSDT